MKRSHILVVAVLVAAGAVAAWLLLQRPAEVSGARARYGEAAQVIYATGFVEPRQPVEVAARVTAPIRDVLVGEGDRVSRGQPLARLEDDEQRQAIAQLAAQTANAEADEARALTLFGRGFVSASARDRAVATARSARAAEAAARARLDQFTVRSGISGEVLRQEAYAGDLAGPNKTLFVLGDPSLLRVTATVDERDIPRVREGQPVLMSSDAFPGRVFEGVVREVTPGGDPSQRAFRVYIYPRTDAPLPIGLTLEVNIVAQRRERALLVPSEAVADGQVWLVEDGRARRGQVATGIEGTERTEIRGGLSAGACVLTDPPEGLEEGARVTVEGC